MLFYSPPLKSYQASRLTGVKLTIRINLVKRVEGLCSGDNVFPVRYELKSTILFRRNSVVVA
jgi:hypothetical protein